MAAPTPLCHLLKINSFKLSKQENLLLETVLFNRMCEELKTVFRTQYTLCFHLMNFTKEMEQEMLDSKLIYFLINDILLTDEYSLEGISHYTQTPEEVIYDLASAKNINPSLMLSRKIIDLHYSVRRELYTEIMKKIVNEYANS